MERLAKVVLKCKCIQPVKGTDVRQGMARGHKGYKRACREYSTRNNENSRVCL